MNTIIILAAGEGKRIGADGNKLFLNAAGKPILYYTLQAIKDADCFDELIVVHADGEENKIKEIILELKLALPIHFVKGGTERQLSVKNAIKYLSPTVNHVLIHDGARPNVKATFFKEMLSVLEMEDAAIYAIPVQDTLKEVDESEYITKTCSRQNLYRAQTPQGFKRNVLEKMNNIADEALVMATDDSSLAELLGIKVKILLGEEINNKITTLEDYYLFRYETERKTTMPRIGYGYDVHRFQKGRPLIIGGVNIPCSKGLLGHSDADVLTHAIMDALLGAAGLADIGCFFPDTDEKYEGVSSIKLLSLVREILIENNWQIGNIDSVIIAEEPKISPYKEEILINLAKALEIKKENIGIKATTHEKMGALGAGLGMAAQATALIWRRQ